METLLEHPPHADLECKKHVQVFPINKLSPAGGALCHLSGKNETLRRVIDQSGLTVQEDYAW